MNFIWFGLFVPMYSFGFFIAMLSAGICLAAGRQPGTNITAVTLSTCFAYVAFSYVVFGIVPKWMKKRLHRKVAPFKDDGFFATWELESLTLTSYIGIDSDDGRLLLVDLYGTQRKMPIRDVTSWEVAVERNRYMLHLHTQLGDLPAYSMRIGRSKAQWCVANLRRLIG